MRTCATCCPGLFYFATALRSSPWKPFSKSTIWTDRRDEEKHHHYELSCSVMKCPWGCLFPVRRPPCYQTLFTGVLLLEKRHVKICAESRLVWMDAREIPDTNIRQLVEVKCRCRSCCRSHWDKCPSRSGAERHNAALTDCLSKHSAMGRVRSNKCVVSLSGWHATSAAVEHCGQNYTEASCLNGWAGQRLWRWIAWVAWNTTVKRYFNLNYTGFVGSIRNSSLWLTTRPHVEVKGPRGLFR